MKKNGYTLMELVVVIGVMAMIIGAGMAVFYQSLKSGSRVDFGLFVDGSSRVIEGSMVGLIGFSRVISVAGQDQDVCLAAGSDGVSGDSLIIEILGKMTEYSLTDDNIASSSTNPDKEIQVNPDGLTINTLNFEWICMYGVKERMEVSFDAQAEKEGQEVPVEKSFSFDLLIKNSGY